MLWYVEPTCRSMLKYSIGTVPVEVLPAVDVAIPEEALVVEKLPAGVAPDNRVSESVGTWEPSSEAQKY